MESTRDSGRRKVGGVSVMEVSGCCEFGAEVWSRCWPLSTQSGHWRLSHPVQRTLIRDIHGKTVLARRTAERPICGTGEAELIKQSTSVTSQLQNASSRTIQK
jgi:hypothetical protein